MQKTYNIIGDIDEIKYNYYLNKPFTIRILDNPTETHTLVLCDDVYSYSSSSILDGRYKLQYSLDNNTWTDIQWIFDYDESYPVTFTSHIYLRAKNTQDFINNITNYEYYSGNQRWASRTRFRVSSTSKIAIEGNAAYLVDYEGKIPQTLAKGIFGGDIFNIASSVENLVLPYTNLSENCYYSLFSMNTQIELPPLFPKKFDSLAKNCFATAFRGCIALSKLPAINADNYPDSCCYLMFRFLDTNTNRRFFISSTKTDKAIYPYRLPLTGTATANNSAFNAMFAMWTNSTTYNNFTPQVNTTFYTSIPIK